jgi:predicted ester cyclase
MTMTDIDTQTIEANKASMHRYVDEVLNQGKFEFADESRGEFAAQAKVRIAELRRAFPDLHTTIETLIAEGDWVAFRFSHVGTHEGEFLGVPATGKRVAFRTIGCNRFADGIVVENWGLHDFDRVLEELRSDQDGDSTSPVATFSGSSPDPARG